MYMKWRSMCTKLYTSTVW